MVCLTSFLKKSLLKIISFVEANGFDLPWQGVPGDVDFGSNPFLSGNLFLLEEQLLNLETLFSQGWESRT